MDWTPTGGNSDHMHFTEMPEAAAEVEDIEEEDFSRAQLAQWLPVELGGVAGRRFRLARVVAGVGFERPGHSGDVGQIGRRTSQRRRPTLQEELPVVDDPGTLKAAAEETKSPPGGRGVVLGHVGSVVDGDPSDGRDIPAAGGLTSR
ncbi:hypothetical protein EYF80_003365 [Liparis tanakae]|uniref:Uncharacterized protein n=1 Tax=Liparis tanakae TaxID=230148 RepID=A0A4Z2J858_9TELE|nr:hypothetical protein EYF80_003365 [Liparis tanakae]